jgi:hypothetical protein
VENDKQPATKIVPLKPGQSDITAQISPDQDGRASSDDEIDDRAGSDDQNDDRVRSQ